MRRQLLCCHHLRCSFSGYRSSTSIAQLNVTPYLEPITQVAPKQPIVSSIISSSSSASSSTPSPSAPSSPTRSLSAPSASTPTLSAPAASSPIPSTRDINAFLSQASSEHLKSTSIHSPSPHLWFWNTYTLKYPFLSNTDKWKQRTRAITKWWLQAAESYFRSHQHNLATNQTLIVDQICTLKGCHLKLHEWPLRKCLNSLLLPCSVAYSVLQYQQVEQGEVEGKCSDYLIHQCMLWYTLWLPLRRHMLTADRMKLSECISSLEREGSSLVAPHTELLRPLELESMGGFTFTPLQENYLQVFEWYVNEEYKHLPITVLYEICCSMKEFQYMRKDTQHKLLDRIVLELQEMNVSRQRIYSLLEKATILENDKDFLRYPDLSSMKKLKSEEMVSHAYTRLLRGWQIPFEWWEHLFKNVEAFSRRPSTALMEAKKESTSLCHLFSLDTIRNHYSSKLIVQIFLKEYRVLKGMELAGALAYLKGPLMLCIMEATNGIDNKATFKNGSTNNLKSEAYYFANKIGGNRIRLEESSQEWFWEAAVKFSNKMVEVCKHAHLKDISNEVCLQVSRIMSLLYFRLDLHRSIEVSTDRELSSGPLLRGEPTIDPFVGYPHIEDRLSIMSSLLTALPHFSLPLAAYPHCIPMLMILQSLASVAYGRHGKAEGKNGKKKSTEKKELNALLQHSKIQGMLQSFAEQLRSRTVLLSVEGALTYLAEADKLKEIFESDGRLSESRTGIEVQQLVNMLKQNALIFELNEISEARRLYALQSKEVKQYLSSWIVNESENCKTISELLHLQRVSSITERVANKELREIATSVLKRNDVNRAPTSALLLKATEALIDPYYSSDRRVERRILEKVLKMDDGLAMDDLARYVTLVNQLIDAKQNHVKDIYNRLSTYLKIRPLCVDELLDFVKVADFLRYNRFLSSSLLMEFIPSLQLHLRRAAETQHVPHPLRFEELSELAHILMDCMGRGTMMNRQKYEAHDVDDLSKPQDLDTTAQKMALWDVVKETLHSILTIANKRVVWKEEDAPTAAITRLLWVLAAMGVRHDILCAPLQSIARRSLLGSVDDTDLMSYFHDMAAFLQPDEFPNFHKHYAAAVSKKFSDADDTTGCSSTFLYESHIASSAQLELFERALKDAFPSANVSLNVVTQRYRRYSVTQGNMTHLILVFTPFSWSSMHERDLIPVNALLLHHYRKNNTPVIALDWRDFEFANEHRIAEQLRSHAAIL